MGKPHLIRTQAGKTAVIHAPSLLQGELKMQLEEKGFFVRTKNDVLFAPLKDELLNTPNRIVHRSDFAELMKNDNYGEFYPSAIRRATEIRNGRLKLLLEKQYRHYKEIAEKKNRHWFIAQSVANYREDGKEAELFAVFQEGGKGYAIVVHHRNLPKWADIAKLGEAFQGNGFSFQLSLRVSGTNSLAIMKSGIATLRFSGSIKALELSLRPLAEGIAAVFNMNGSGAAGTGDSSVPAIHSHRHLDNGHQ